MGLDVTPLRGSREAKGLDRSVARKLGHADRRRSTCSRCGRGVFTDQAVLWSRDPMGLVHASCPEPPGGRIVGLPSEQGGDLR